jgi:pyruvate/2-oxoglutarate/acetoin dehydrogenase E1 component
MVTVKKPMSKTARMLLVREAKKLVGVMNKTNVTIALRNLKSDLTRADARIIVDEAIAMVKSKTTKN